MAESPEDKDVDSLINEMQAALDKLKRAQRKDVTDESQEEAQEPPRTLGEARVRVRTHFRRTRARQDAVQQ